MLNEQNQEFLEKARTAPSAAALFTMAEENGITLTTDEAANLYAQLHSQTGALSDAELDGAAGGTCFRMPKN